MKKTLFDARISRDEAEMREAWRATNRRLRLLYLRVAIRLALVLDVIVLALWLRSTR